MRHLNKLLVVAMDGDLSLKTCVLLALASTKYISELHGVFYEVEFFEHWNFCTFTFIPDFITKMSARFAEFSTPSLHDFIRNGCRH